MNCSAGYKIHRYITPDKLRSVFFVTESYILFLNHVLPVLHICIARSSSGWSHYLAFGFLHRSTGRTTRFMTSSSTSWSDCSMFTSTRRSLRRRPVGWVARYLILRQPTDWIVCRFIVSYAGGSPAKLEDFVYRFVCWLTMFCRRCMSCVISRCSMLSRSGC